MSSDNGPNRRSRLLNNLTTRLALPIPRPGASSSSSSGNHRRLSHSASLLQPLASSPTSTQYNGGGGGGGGGDRYRASSPTYSDNMSSNNHGSGGNNVPEVVRYRNDDDLVPPVAPFVPSGSNLSSRRSSLSFLGGGGGGGGDKGDKDSSLLKNQRPSSLSLNYVPAKFTRLHAPGDHAHRRTTKQGGGRDAFAKNASRMGEVGTVDDDEGVVFQLGKGGLKRKNKPKLRWNRFKWVLFVANTVLIAYGMASLVSAILVWLNVFYQSDVIRVGNRTELIISTIAATLIVLTSLIGYAGILLNNRAFLAVYTLLLWICFGLMVTPGYMTYKQRTFNLEGKINSQWSRNLGAQGRLRIQDALRCCGYYSPFVEATVSPLCYARSNFPGCKSRYLHLERRVLGIWYAISFALVPAHLLIILAALLCSNHITYRFGKGLTPKRYRLDLGSMAVIMDEYASQIAAQYGPNVAAEAVNRSSVALPLGPEYDNASLSVPTSRPGSISHSASSLAPPYSNVANPRYTNSGGGGSGAATPGSTRGVSLYDPTNPRASFDMARRDSDASGSVGARYFETEATRSNHMGGTMGNESVVSFSSDDHRQNRR
ncbi:hypothetical protein IAR55_005275 [Kwoniella newhampshirensis]|uniref:Tetraspanin Tsp2 n=1 Tax=Kwoniella newhampshirensis TaxID=1651941 RepID=A0AAW0YV85_9TREE